MLTAHALTPEALKKSVKLGAVSFVPKEKMPILKEFVQDAIHSAGKPIWENVLIDTDRISTNILVRTGRKRTVF